MNQTSSSVAVGTGSATAMFGALSINDWAIIIGIACTIGTFSVNWYYKRKSYQLMEDQAAHQNEKGVQ